MSDTSGPWDGLPWAEADWYRHVTLAMPSGVHGPTPGVTVADGGLAWAATGLTITPTPGRANVGGAGYVRAAPVTSVTTTANTHATFSRRDRLVLRRSLSAHTVTLAVLPGTPASTPTAPPVTRTDTVWELPLFSFLVPPNSGTTITGVLDERLFVSPAGGDSVAYTKDALDAQAVAGMEGVTAFVQTGAARGSYVCSGGVWTLLGAWTELVSAPTYSWAVPVTGTAQTFPTIAGTSDVVVTVPAGRTLEVELSLPACTVGSGTTAYARLTDVGASNVLDGVAYSTPAGTSTAASTKLTGRVLGTGATVTVRPQAWVAAGSLTIAGSVVAAASVKIAWRVI